MDQQRNEAEEEDRRRGHESGEEGMEKRQDGGTDRGGQTRSGREIGGA